MTARARLSPPFTDVVAYGNRPVPVGPRSAPVSQGDIKLSGGANAAAGYAIAAQASADAASASANAAAASAAGVASSVTAAANSATAAANSASDAAGSATEAGDAEDAALGYASAAAASSANAAVSYSSFRNMYYGPAAADPATRPDTTPRVTGDLYYRTSAPLGMKVWSGSAWAGAFVGEAPTDGQQYARQNATWAVVTGGGGGGGGIPEAPADSKEYVRYNSAWIALDWSILDGKPSTFPYATPIPQTDVQNLVSNLAAKQASDATLTALAALDATPGLLEQTGPDAFTKRAMGVGASTSILTRADGDGRYLGDAPSDGTTYGRKNAAWVATAAGGASITISDTAPSTPAAGALWWESDTGKLWIYYNDGTSSQWVEAAAPAVGHNITISTFDPSGGNDGDVWYKVA